MEFCSSKRSNIDQILSLLFRLFEQAARKYIYVRVLLKRGTTYLADATFFRKFLGEVIKKNLKVGDKKIFSYNKKHPYPNLPTPHPPKI